MGRSQSKRLAKKQKGRLLVGVVKIPYTMAIRASREVGAKYDNEKWYRGTSVIHSEEIGWFVIVRAIEGSAPIVEESYNRIPVKVEFVDTRELL